MSGVEKDRQSHSWASSRGALGLLNARKHRCSRYSNHGKGRNYKASCWEKHQKEEKTVSLGLFLCSEEGIVILGAVQARIRHVYISLRMDRLDAEDLRDSVLPIE